MNAFSIVIWVYLVLIFIELVVGNCSSTIIDENQLSSPLNIWNMTTLVITKNNPSPTTMYQNSYCCKLAPISA